jgi:hypothetical protein
MQATYSFESILRAVGRVLDQSGVRGISLHETDDGLIVEGVDHQGQTQVRLTYGLGDLCDLIDHIDGNVAGLEETVPAAAESYTLREFLARHEMVSAR